MTTTPTVPNAVGPVPAAQPTQVAPKSTAPVSAAPKPATSLVSQVVAASARRSPMVTKLQGRTKSTFDIVSPWARILVHGEIDSLKTTVAHHFGKPEQCRTILTRGEDQMLPVINEGYKYVKVDNAEEFTEALSYCDSIWPDWAKHPDPILIVDDITRAKDYVVSSSKYYSDSSGNQKEYKDNRKVFGVAMGEFDAMFTIANKKPIHIVLTGLSKVVEGKISLEETVMPDLSQGIGNLIMSDYSFIWFLNKKKPVETRLLTEMDNEAVTEYSETAKMNVTYQRYYFARSKVPSELVGKVIKKYEPANLRAVWDKVMAARKGQIAKP